MQNIFTTYPDVPWKSGWKFCSGPGSRLPFITASPAYSLTVPNGDWMLQLIEPERICTTRLFYNGFSIGLRRRPEKNRIDALITEPGLLCGTILGLPIPKLFFSGEIKKESGCEWLHNDGRTVLLLWQGNRFVLVYGEYTHLQALAKAEAALDENFEKLMQVEAEERANVSQLFSANPRHNPPVALAAETLTARLRDRTSTLHGLWSVAEGFTTETFSLNELYPLVRAWSLVDPPIALELVKTALSLQQSSGGFPAWIDTEGISSPSAAWPLIAQSFELAWTHNHEDPALLKKYLPALRKYMQWAMRRFDPQRDRVPSWQSEQEVFIPGSFERGKATPEIAVFFITEIEAVLRLCEACDHAETVAVSLVEDRNRLAQTLNTLFWNPSAKAFSNVWNNGSCVHEPSFGSFMPLFWQGLDSDKQAALMEHLEESHGFPGQRESSSWEHDDMDDSKNRPAMHQFMAFEAIRAGDSARSLLMLFVRRSREGFSAWFEREALEAIRGKTSGASAYLLGPVTAALILTVQAEFEREAARVSSIKQWILRCSYRLKIRPFEVYFVLGALITIVLVHQLYVLPHSRNAESHVVEATLDYQHGRFREALVVCRRYPQHPASQFIQANILMLAERPDQAEDLYRQVLSKKPGSPSALFGLALALQMNGEFKQAEKRYVDFLDIYERRFPRASQIADEYRMLSQEEFSKPPRWRQVFTLQLMNDLGL